MKNYKSINVPPKVHARLRLLADANHRTIGGQVTAMVEMVEAAENAIPLHNPDDDPPEATAATEQP